MLSDKLFTLDSAIICSMSDHFHKIVLQTLHYRLKGESYDTQNYHV